MPWKTLRGMFRRTSGRGARQPYGPEARQQRHRLPHTHGPRQDCTGQRFGSPHQTGSRRETGQNPPTDPMRHRPRPCRFGHRGADKSETVHPVTPLGRLAPHFSHLQHPCLPRIGPRRTNCDLPSEPWFLFTGPHLRRLDISPRKSLRENPEKLGRDAAKGTSAGTMPGILSLQGCIMPFGILCWTLPPCTSDIIGPKQGRVNYGKYVICALLVAKRNLISVELMRLLRNLPCLALSRQRQRFTMYSCRSSTLGEG